MKHKGYNDATTGNGNDVAQKFKYNQGTSGKNFLGEEGKSFKVERQEELGLNLDMTKFRMYDYTLGRFTSIDPLADANPQESLTPYQYAYNSPIQYNDPYGDCPKCWDFIVNVFKATRVKSVSAGLGAGGRISNTGGTASVSEFEYNFESKEFSYSALKLFGGFGDSQDAAKGEVRVAYSSKSKKTDKNEAGFIKLEGSTIRNGKEKGGSITVFGKNKKGEKGAVLTEKKGSEKKEGVSEVSPPDTSFQMKLKFIVGVTLSFDWNKFDRLQMASKAKREQEARENE